MPSEEVIQWREALRPKPQEIPRWQTPLRERLNEFQLQDFTTYTNHKINSHFASLGGWRRKLKVYEKRMEDCMDDRAATTEGPLNSGGMRSIFEKSNETLNVVGGFADFAFSQARQDLFGSAPFFDAQAVGLDDKELADTIDHHSNWKLGESNLQRTMTEALELAFHLGTAFPKTVWKRSFEEYERDASIRFDNGKPVVKEDGAYWYQGELPEEEEEPFEYRRMRVTETEIYFDNIDCQLVGFRDIAWDVTAPELSLEYTDVFHRTRRRLYDLAAQLDLDEDTINELRTAAVTPDHIEGADDSEEDARQHREETKPDEMGEQEEGSLANPKIGIVECFMRLDVLQTGTPIRVFAMYCPALDQSLFIDYLANVTPGGMLPFQSPVRCYQVPGRVYGRGFHEKYENVQDYVDANFNAASWSNALNRNPPGGVDLSELEEDIEDQEGKIVADPTKLYKLKSGGDMKKAFQFAETPPDSDRSIELAGLMIEMAQLRTGISSAAQGELSNLPQANTATGIRQLMSRSATLLRWPIDAAEKDLEKTLNYAVALLYANHNRTETFTWGEGRNAEVLTLSPQEVRGLKMHVRFKMVQSQNEAKLEASQTGITVIQGYVNLPEFEKGPVRELFIQALQSLDFHDPDSMIREPVLTYEGLLEQLPPELAVMLAQNSQFHAEQLEAAQEQEQGGKPQNSEAA